MQYYGFFNGEQEYGQEEFSRLFDNIYESGVSVKSDDTLGFGIVKDQSTLKVSEGYAIVKGFYLYNDSYKNISVLKDSSFDRIDRVVIRLNINERKVSIEYKLGTPQSNPKAPTLQRDNLIYELSLAQVRVNKNGEIIISDERYNMDLCGTIRPKNLTEFNSMIKDYSAKFDRWFESQQAKGWRNIFIQSQKPSGSVAGSIWIELA